MQGPELFAWTVGIYSVLPLLYAIKRTSFQFLLLYSHLASLLTLGSLLGGVYLLPVGHVTLQAGQVCYAGFMFATFITLVLGRDLQVLRNVIVLTFVVNVMLYAVLTLSRHALGSAQIPNPLELPMEVFEQSLDAVLLGGLLIVIELVLLISILELAKGHLGSLGMAVVYPVTYVVILMLDGVLYPTVVLRPEAGLGEMIVDGIQGKLVLALAFVVPLLVFVGFFRRTLTMYESRPLQVRHLLSLSRDDLLAELDHQQLMLREQQDRIVTSTADVGRATATVDRILDSATNSILIALDRDLRITHFNTGAQNLLGYTRAEVIGHPLRMLHTDEEIARQAAALGTTADYRGVVEAQLQSRARRDWEFVTRRGPRRMVSLSLTEVLVDGQVIGHVAAGEDVTSRLRAETAMMTALTREHDALVRLQEADRVKNELVSTVSHELRTPIASISGYTELLHDGSYGALSDQQVHALDRVLRNTHRLEEIVEDLLVLERVETTPLPLDRVRTDLCEVIRGTEDMVAEMVRGRDLKFNVALPSHPVVIEGDRAALERVALNLISNAVKFTPGRGTVALRVTTDSRDAILRISDTGIGITPEEQPQLFVRFFRTAKANELAIPGSGLGLAIVRAIVAAHDGEVVVNSSAGLGTTVTVTLPLAVEWSRAATEAAAPGAAPGPVSAS